MTFWISLNKNSAGVQLKNKRSSPFLSCLCCSTVSNPVLDSFSSEETSSAFQLNIDDESEKMKEQQRMILDDARQYCEMKKRRRKTYEVDKNEINKQIVYLCSNPTDEQLKNHLDELRTVHKKSDLIKSNTI